MGDVNQSIGINASVEQVWQEIRDFHNVNWAKGVLNECKPVGEKKGTEAGAKRILNGAIHETLIEVDEDNNIIRYSIDDGPSPISKEDISNYVGTIKLTESGDETTVNWSSKWDGGSDTACSEFCGPIYIALLEKLKTTLEG